MAKEMSSFRNPLAQLSFRCYELLNKEDFVDVTIVADGRFLQAHKLVLAAASSYFKEIFDIIPDKQPAIVLKDISYRSLQLMIQYIYTGSIDIPKEDIAAFGAVLDSLKIEFDIEASDDGNEEHHEFALSPDEVPLEDFDEFDADMDIEEPTFTEEVKVKEEPKDDGYEANVVPKPAKQPILKTFTPIEKSRAFRKVVIPGFANASLGSAVMDMLKKPNPVRRQSTSTPTFRQTTDLPQKPGILRIQQPSVPMKAFEGKIHIGRVVPSKSIQLFMNDNPGLCPFCKKFFNTPKHRNEHVKYCFENPHRVVSVCSLCNKNVCDPYYLRKHMKNVHGITSTS